VIIPTYQRRELVMRAAASVLRQTHRDFELIVVDDGSTDGTERALAPFAGGLRYHWQPNRGVSAARNAGIELARGSIVAFLDSDDRMLPDHLAVLTGALARHPTAVLASTCPFHLFAGRERASDARLVDFRGRLFESRVIGLPMCVAVRRDALFTVGGFDERMKAGEGGDLFLRLATVGAFAVVRRRTIVRELIPGSLSDRARRAGDYLTAFDLSVHDLASAAERLPQSERARVSDQARGLVHFARAMRALDRHDAALLSEQLAAAGGLLSLSNAPFLTWWYVVRVLPRSHERSERLWAFTALADLWPDRRADTARFMRLSAIATACRAGRLGQARGLLRRWPPGETLRFAWRLIPTLRHIARRSAQDRRRRGRGTPAIDPGSRRVA
jgi:glycosyltransferase involved in cell wall biosynthesis